jgi:uncharacterized protein
MSHTIVLEIGSVRAAPGERAQGFVDVGETATGPVAVPLVIVNGKTAGPVLCLTAGVHATEYAPIEATFRILHALDPASLKGAVIAVPVASMHMFASRCGFVSPVDGLNLNKVAPGGDGSISEILVRFLLAEVISKARYHIDLHAGDLGEMLLAFAGYSLTGDSQLDCEGEALARLFTPRLISLARDGGTLPPFAGSIAHAATRRGIVSILAESGGNGTLEEGDVRVHVEGVHNIMRYLGMIRGEPSICGPRIRATDRAVTRAKRAGLLRLKVAVGDEVRDGQQVAEVVNVFGEVVETVCVKRGGIAGLVWAHKAVNTGDPIVRCWYTESAPAFPLTDKFMRPQSASIS